MYHKISLVQLDDIANAVLFLSSNNASFINGEVLVVDGGQLASFS